MIPSPSTSTARPRPPAPFGGLIGSGFQTLLVAFRLVYQERIINAASLGSPGLDELRWPRPVRPGDTLRVTGEVVEIRPSRSKPDRGVVTIAYTVANQARQPVMSFRAHAPVAAPTAGCRRIGKPTAAEARTQSVADAGIVSHCGVMHGAEAVGGALAGHAVLRQSRVASP